MSCKPADEKAALLTLTMMLDSLIHTSSVEDWGIDWRVYVSEPKEFYQRCKDALWYAINQLDE